MKKFQATWQTQPVPVNVDPHPSLPVGTEFTIKGIRLLPDGSFETNCKPEMETVMVVSDRPSIYRLRK